LQVTYRIHIDDATLGKQRRFTLKFDDIPYPHAPRVGERVVVPTSEPSSGHLGAREVKEVIYDPFGGVLLDIHVDGLHNDVEEQVKTLKLAGFKEIIPSGENLG